MTPLRVVLDTNVLVSALLFPRSSLSWLRTAWRSGTIVPLAGGETTRELLRVLCYPKFRLTEEDREDVLADYLPWCETITAGAEAAVPDCRDPFDRPFLELAVSGRADALVTGDSDLRALAPLFPVPILTPAALKRLLHGTRVQ